jgi:Protein of unknown function (DUF2778)
MWFYSQKTGCLSRDGLEIAHGYSGHGDGKNSPDAQSIANYGPIPRGEWSIGEPFDTSTHGPYVMRLTPQGGTNTYGRSGFLIHGDAKHDPGNASQGCIILNRATRENIWKSDDHEITVV